MSVLDDGAFAPLRPTERRPLGCGAGFALAAAVAFLFHRAAPGAPAMSAGFAGVSGLAALALAFTLDDAALPSLTKALAAGVGLLVLCALVGPEPRLRLAGFASAALGVGLAVWLARLARIRVSGPLVAVFAVALALLSVYATYLVLASRDLMIADFMTYRGIAMMVARLADAGDWPLLLNAAVQSITQDYSWAPGLVPGLLLALTEPTSRALYTFALLTLYAAPAAVALSILARDCACRAGLARDAPSAIVLALGVAAVFVAYPAAMAVAARGMPDVGGLVLVVCALKLAERLARLLALGPGHDARVEPMIRRVAVALVLTLYAMFAFRRWYAFAASGIVVMLALEVLSMALRRGARFRWKDAVAAAALGALTLLALLNPVLVDWAPNLGAHDYAQTYAGYRKPPDVFLRELGDWVGLIPALAALAGAAFLWARSRDKRLLRLTLGGAAIAAVLFLRIQTPYIHHLDLIAPAIVVPIAASLTLIFATAPRRASRSRSAWRDHALAACKDAQSAGPGADRRIAASAARRPRRTEATEGLGRAAGAARGQGLRPRLELYVQRPAHRRIVAAPPGAGSERAQARRRDAGRRYGRRAARSGPEGLRCHRCGRSGPDPPRSQLPADGHRPIARNADGAGDRREVPPHRRNLPSGEWRKRGRVRAPGFARRR
jgi:hypothetical protein